MVINWIFDSTKTKSTVEDSPTIFFITLTEAWVLVQLRQDFIQRRDWVVALQVLQLLLYGPAGQLVVLALLEEVAVLARMHAIWK